MSASKPDSVVVTEAVCSWKVLLLAGPYDDEVERSAMTALRLFGSALSGELNRRIDPCGTAAAEFPFNEERKSGQEKEPLDLGGLAGVNPTSSV